MSYCSFSGGEEYKNHFQPGMYVCSECGHELFSSTSKFEHSSPWPAFSQTIHEDSVSKHPEAWGPIKVCCGKCGNGLGHEFLYDGPREGLSRFWIFSSSLTFIPKEKVDGQKGELWKRREDCFLLLKVWTVDEVLRGKAWWSSGVLMDVGFTRQQEQNYLI